MIWHTRLSLILTSPDRYTITYDLGRVGCIAEIVIRYYGLTSSSNIIVMAV